MCGVERRLRRWDSGEMGAGRAEPFLQGSVVQIEWKRSIDVYHHPVVRYTAGRRIQIGNFRML